MGSGGEIYGNDTGVIQGIETHARLCHHSPSATSHDARPSAPPGDA